MSWWNKVKEIFSTEAAEVEERMRAVGKSLDAELERRERKQNATPAEGLDIVLEEVEASNARLDELTKDLEPETATAGGGPLSGDRARLLDRSDLARAPGLEAALEWVTVEAPQTTDPLFDRFDHCAWIEDRANDAITEAELSRLASVVADHPLVEEVVHEDRDVLYVRALSLHHEDVRLLVADALARVAPDDIDDSGQ